MTRADRDTPGVPLPPPLFFVIGFLVGLGLELAWPIPGLATLPALLIAAAGVAIWLYLDGAASLSFRRAGTNIIPFKPATALVTSGPYRVSRNPMYVGMAALYVALAIGFGVIWALIVLPLVLVAVDRLVIVREERYLERKFGPEYLAYKQRVRRWL